MIRRLLTPRWLALHVFAILSTYALVRIGMWQWHRAQHTGRLQNYSYAVEWELFAAFAVFLWGKLVLDELRPVSSRPAPVASAQRRPEAPVAPAGPPEEDDEELAAYNRHLAWLHSHPRS